jgi:hypothetical protein
MEAALLQLDAASQAGGACANHHDIEIGHSLLSISA